MLKKLSFIVIALALATSASLACAHTLWVNAYESKAHLPGHVISCIAYGHSLPMDDLFNEIKIKTYDLYDPNLKKTALAIPKGKTASPQKQKAGPTIQTGDSGLTKFTLTEKSPQGTYQIAVKSKETYYSNYINQKGRKKWALTSMDKVKSAKKVISGMRYQAFAKAYFNKGDWATPKPLGYELEIIPQTDLSKVKVGDLVELKIFFRGKPLTTSPEKSIEYITANSNTFGGPDRFSLAAIIFNGKAQFRMPTAGQWMLNVYVRKDVTEKNELKHLAKKCTASLYSSSISFNVKP